MLSRSPLRKTTQTPHEILPESSEKLPLFETSPDKTAGSHLLARRRPPTKTAQLRTGRSENRLEETAEETAEGTAEGTHLLSEI